MPTRSSRARRHANVLSRLLVAAVAASLAAALLAGCSLFGPAVGGGDGPLVSIDAQGGHCLEAPAGR